MTSNAERQRIGIAVVQHRGRYLVGVRESDVPLGGHTEFPGGKCRAGEPPAACAIRETFEETGLRVRIVEPLLVCDYDYPHARVTLHFFLCRPQSEVDRATERRSFRWAEAAELPGLDFPPANAAVIRKLVERDGTTPSGRLRHA